MILRVQDDAISGRDAFYLKNHEKNLKERCFFGVSTISIQVTQKYLNILLFYIDIEI